MMSFTIEIFLLYWPVVNLLIVLCSRWLFPHLLYWFTFGYGTI